MSTCNASAKLLIVCSHDIYQKAPHHLVPERIVRKIFDRERQTIVNNERFEKDNCFLAYNSGVDQKFIRICIRVRRAIKCVGKE